MVRTDHIDLQSQVRDLFHQFENQRGIEQKDIGIIFFCMRHDIIAHGIIEFFKTGIMLTKRVT